MTREAREFREAVSKKVGNQASGTSACWSGPTVKLPVCIVAGHASSTLPLRNRGHVSHSNEVLMKSGVV
ncbi:hypothetical protein P8C59_004347 [Phyllachora maydis]|uniref:Uncharacterized protein n=1 Tax=Phyllachora maydis TaxID=1825666 RepID=A0AAD9I3D9_9PEZI|nr:hypothetical protein P8C59_004347 [Phyllachora maydis]